MINISFDDFASENERGRIIGLDIGNKTVGIAISDENQTIASVLTTISRTKIAKDVDTVKRYISEYRAVGLVYGWPLQTNGQPGEQCEKVVHFISFLDETVPMLPWDERFSTKITENMLISANVSRKKRSKVIDGVAAVYILQGALDLLQNIRRESA